MSAEATTPVTVTVVPGRSQAVLVAEGATVGEALRAADVSAEGMQIRVSGRTVTTDQEVQGGDQIVLSRQIKGN